MAVVRDRPEVSRVAPGEHADGRHGEHAEQGMPGVRSVVHARDIGVNADGAAGAQPR